MRVGPGIALLAIGAILAFAITDTSIGPVQVSLVGYILMGAGVLGIILGLVLTANQRRGTRSTTRRVIDDGTNPPREEVTRRDID